MTATVSLSSLLFFLVCLHFEAFALPTRTCRCCAISNGTGECLNTTACTLIGVNSSSTTETNHAGCEVVCSTVNASHCHPQATVTVTRVTVTSAIDTPRSKVVEIACASVITAIVVILVFIGLLVYCHLKRVEKDPPKMLPNAQEIDESIRFKAAVIVTEDEVTSAHQSKTAGVSGRPTPTSSLKHSHSLRQDKEDWTPPGIRKSGPSSPETSKPSSPPSPLSVSTDDKLCRARRASNEKQHTYKNVEIDKKVHNYINVDGLVNNDDDNNSPDYVETCPDYVNTPSRNSADDGDDLDYENVDVNVTPSQMTSPETSKAASMQSKSPMLAPQSKASPLAPQSKASPLAPQSKGSPLAPQSKASPLAPQSKASLQSKSPPLAPQSKASILTASSNGKAVSSDWLASIRGDRAAQMDPDYVDMDAKSKAKTMFPFDFNIKETESAATFVSAPDVRMTEMKPKPVRTHMYENQNVADHRQPKTTTAQNLSTTNL